MPIPLLSKINKELVKLEAEGIIEKIIRPTAWCAPMLPVTKKSGKVRLCVDLKKLNLSVKRERYALPTLEDVTSKLSGASVFSSLPDPPRRGKLQVDDIHNTLREVLRPKTSVRNYLRSRNLHEEDE